MDGDDRSSSSEVAGFFDRLSAAALREAWDASPALVAVTAGPEHRLVYQNPASRAVFGTAPLGLPMGEAFPEAGPAGVAPFARAFETGTVVDMPRHAVALRDVTGGEVVLRYVVAPLRGPDGTVVGTVLLAVDVTAEAHAERDAERTRLLAELATVVTGAADAAAGLQALTDALVPAIADLAAVYVLPTQDRTPSEDPVPPQALTLGPGLRPLGPPPTPTAREEPSPWDAMLRSGRAVVIAVEAQSLPTVAPDAAAAQWLRSARAHSIAVAPLVVAGTLTGVLLLLAAGDRPAFRDQDLPFLSDMTARAGAAITQLRTQHRLREVALHLQRALLPPAPAELPGLTVAARYVAGSADAEAGGDWYDVQDLGAGRVGLGIGDVAGRGIAAAAVMGQARVAMRTAGLAHLPPAQLLHLLDAQLAEVALPDRVGDPAPPRFATACYAVVEPALGVLRATNAGHLPLLVRGRDGTVRTVTLPPASPLGLLVGGFTETDVPFRPGETLAMFTDGLVESRDEDLDDGIAALADAFGRVGADPDLERVADEILAAVDRRQGHGDDDVALLLARAHPGAASPAPSGAVSGGAERGQRRGKAATSAPSRPGRPGT